jgi:hypothetical protein
MASPLFHHWALWHDPNTKTVVRDELLRRAG